eukprot:1005926-Rhodomonas_salina.1
MNRFLALALALLCAAIAVHGGTVDECMAADQADQPRLTKCHNENSKKFQSLPVNKATDCEEMKYDLPCTTKSACCSGDALAVFQGLYDALQCTGFNVTDYCGTYPYPPSSPSATPSSPSLDMGLPVSKTYRVRKKKKKSSSVAVAKVAYQAADSEPTLSSAAGLHVSVFTTLVAAAASLCSSHML